MILAINYADNRYQIAQKFNSRRARKFGADAVRSYSNLDLAEEFKEKNREILKYARGGGYWIWKPYIIRDALSFVKEGDYVVYTDSGSAFVNKIQFLIDCMNRGNSDIMVFAIAQIEKYYTKRDAFILMECDSEQFADTPQICSGYMIFRKTEKTCQFVEDYLKYVQDRRIVTDEPNELGVPNYRGFIENRHDQSVLSLLSKKYGIKPFRDPSEWGTDFSKFSEEINKRSQYPQIIESHRNSKAFSVFQLRYKKWYKYFDVFWYKENIKKIMRK